MAITWRELQHFHFQQSGMISVFPWVETATCSFYREKFFKIKKKHILDKHYILWSNYIITYLTLWLILD